MSEVLAAAGPSRTIVIERASGGTPWWIPLLVALCVAAVAAVASYVATWVFKRADVNRENAARAAGLVHEAEQLVSSAERYDAEPEGGPIVTLRLVTQARVWTAWKRSSSSSSSTGCARDRLPPRLDTPLVFPAVDGGHIDLHGWRADEWTPAVRGAGLSHRPPYALRHTYAALSIAAGISL